MSAGIKFASGRCKNKRACRPSKWTRRLEPQIDENERHLGRHRANGSLMDECRAQDEEPPCWTADFLNKSKRKCRQVAVLPGNICDTRPATGGSSSTCATGTRRRIWAPTSAVPAVCGSSGNPSPGTKENFNFFKSCS